MGVKHEGLAFFFGVCPSAGRDTGPEGAGRPQPGQHGNCCGKSTVEKKKTT